MAVSISFSILFSENVGLGEKRWPGISDQFLVSRKCDSVPEEVLLTQSFNVISSIQSHWWPDDFELYFATVPCGSLVFPWTSCDSGTPLRRFPLRSWDERPWTCIIKSVTLGQSHASFYLSLILMIWVWARMELCSKNSCWGMKEHFWEG